MLDDLVPGKMVAVLDTPYTTLALDQVRKAAAVLRLPLKVFDARGGEAVSIAIANVVEAGAASMLLLEDPVLLGAMKETTNAGQ